MHHRRSEHWVVVYGTPIITVGENTVMMSRNESTYIPIGESIDWKTPASSTWS